MRRAGRTDASDLQVTVNELTPVSEPLGGVRAGCVFGGQLWIRGILKSVAFSALCARKLAELAKLDVLSEVTVGQRLTTNFVVSSGLAKLSRFKLRNRGLQVRGLPTTAIVLVVELRPSRSSAGGEPPASRQEADP